MNATPTFEPLSRLFRGDTDRIRRVLEIFERVTRKDLERMDQVYADRDWVALGGMAHRMKSGCLQIGEASAAAGLAAIERSLPAAGTDAFAREFAASREELDRVMMRVSGYLTAKDGVGEA